MSRHEIGRELEAIQDQLDELRLYRPYEDHYDPDAMRRRQDEYPDELPPGFWREEYRGWGDDTQEEEFRHTYEKFPEEENYEEDYYPSQEPDYSYGDYLPHAEYEYPDYDGSYQDKPEEDHQVPYYNDDSDEDFHWTNRPNFVLKTYEEEDDRDYERPYVYEAYNTEKEEYEPDHLFYAQDDEEDQANRTCQESLSDESDSSFSDDEDWEESEDETDWYDE